MTSAIIVGAGKGIRMRGKISKQYLLLGSRPVLAHTLKIFDNCDLIDRIFIVVPEHDFDYCRKNILCWVRSEKEVRLVPGGAKRQDSVYNGLVAAGDNIKGFVGIHDGVRPFLSSDILSACISGAKNFGACIPGIKAFDTLKQTTGSGIIDKTIEREMIWLAQTPQVFEYNLIRKAHEKARQNNYYGTDDASLVERLGKKVKIIKGSSLNIKITSREDLQLAEAIIQVDF
jgi:2-C-methyl-D-erythritol 4-phosphate cytidylyltransferase